MKGPALEVRRGEAEDVSLISSILVEAAHWLLSKEIDQWARRDFSEERTSSQVSRGEYLIGVMEGEAAGVFRLLWEDPRSWEDSPADAGYVHNLAVAPGFHGRGIGVLLLNQAERLIALQGRKRARLDCMLGSEHLRKYYTNAGYELVGERPDERYNAWLVEKRLF